MRPQPLVWLPLVLALCTAGCATSGASPPSSSPTRIVLPTPGTGNRFSAALVTDVGGLHDASFNQEAWAGLRRARTALGMQISARESHSENQYLPNLEHAAQRHATLTIGVGYSMSRAMYDAAEALPGARFVMIDARPLDPSGHEVSLPNVENLLFREQESGYVAGIVAGKIEAGHIAGARHNTVGYLAGPSIPQVDHYIAGFVAGIHAADPSARILSQSVNSFADPTTGSKVADSQVAAGADITFQVAGQTGTAYLERAQQRGAYAIGVDSDMRYLGDRVLTSAIKKVDVALFGVIKSTESRRFIGGDVRVGAAQGATGIAPFSASVPTSVRMAAQLALHRIASGTLVPPLAAPAR